MEMWQALGGMLGPCSYKANLGDQRKASLREAYAVPEESVVGSFPANRQCDSVIQSQRGDTIQTDIGCRGIWMLSKLMRGRNL